MASGMLKTFLCALCATAAGLFKNALFDPTGATIVPEYVSPEKMISKRYNIKALSVGWFEAATLL